MKTGMTGHSVSIVNLFYVFIGFTVMMQKVTEYKIITCPCASLLYNFLKRFSDQYRNVAL